MILESGPSGCFQLAPFTGSHQGAAATWKGTRMAREDHVNTQLQVILKPTQRGSWPQSFNSQLEALPVANWPITSRIIPDEPGWSLDPCYSVTGQEIAEGMEKHKENTTQKQGGGRPNAEHTETRERETKCWAYCPLAASPSLPDFLTCRSDTSQGLFRWKATSSAHYLWWTTLSSQKFKCNSSHLKAYVKYISGGGAWKSSSRALQLYLGLSQHYMHCAFKPLSILAAFGLAHTAEIIEDSFGLERVFISIICSLESVFWNN